MILFEFLLLYDNYEVYQKTSIMSMYEYSGEVGRDVK